jgi:hypothetical protein
VKPDVVPGWLPKSGKVFKKADIGILGLGKNTLL